MAGWNTVLCQRCYWGERKPIFHNGSKVKYGWYCHKYHKFMDPPPQNVYQCPFYVNSMLFGFFWKRKGSKGVLLQVIK